MWSFYVFPTVFYFLWQHMYLTDIIFVTLNVYCVVCSLLRFFSASSLLRSLSYHFVRCDSYHSFICQLKHRSEVIVHSVCLSVCLIILKFVHNISERSYFTYKSFAFYSNGMCFFSSLRFSLPHFSSFSISVLFTVDCCCCTHSFHSLVAFVAKQHTQFKIKANRNDREKNDTLTNVFIRIKVNS